MSNPMQIRLLALTLQCKKEVVNVPLSHHISFFHGKISSGKSTIVRLIDYCLGGDWKKVRTRAVDDELVSVRLSVDIGANSALFEREAQSNKIRVSWQGPDESGSVLVQTKASSRKPVWGEDVFGLSDMIFQLFNLKPIKVRSGKLPPSSSTRRLGFRDILQFCYLNQEEMISSFFRLNDRLLKNKSRDVMRFVTGDLTERLASLEIRCEELKGLRGSKLRKAKEIRSFLAGFGYESDSQLVEQIEKLNANKLLLESNLGNVHEEYSDRPHLVDDLQERLRTLSLKLDSEQRTLLDLEEGVSRKRKLKNELISIRIMHARGLAAARILSGVKYVFCPACGLQIRAADEVAADECAVCGRSSVDESRADGDDPKGVQAEFDVRIDELSEAIERHEYALSEQRERVRNLVDEKRDLEIQLDRRFDEYDPNLMARTRQLEREIGAIEQKMKGLERSLSMIREIGKQEKEASQLLSDIEEKQREIEQESEKENRVVKFIKDIEQNYIDALLTIGLPGVADSDKVELNRRSWMPSILPGGNKEKAWGFEEAGSAGKKTLMKTCYVLTLHEVARRHEVRLPTLLVIDAPMDHIDKDVNREIFRKFYRHLYHLAKRGLSDTQFIIIDQEYVPPEEELDIYERYMTPDDDAYPPLISYYREDHRNG